MLLILVHFLYVTCIFWNFLGWFFWNVNENERTNLKQSSYWKEILDLPKE